MSEKTQEIIYAGLQLVTVLILAGLTVYYGVIL
jgi:hypothetical protein